MEDLRAKVIKALDCHANKTGCAQNCPYWGDAANLECSVKLAADALALLKEQEPIEPELDVDEWRCGKCGHLLEHQEMLGSNILFHEQYAYCPNCGRKVKHDD